MTSAEFKNLKLGSVVIPLVTTDYYTKGKYYIVRHKYNEWVLTRSDDKGGSNNGLRYGNFRLMPLLRKVK